MNKRFFKSPEFLVWLGFGLSAAALLSYALLDFQDLHFPFGV